MATKLYKGTTPLLSQPSIGGGLMGRAYIGGQLAYGAAPIVWTPESINGITNWWRADMGVTLSGATVTSWVDQIAGKTLTQEGTSTAPDFVASDTTMNNQPAIEFGASGATLDNLSDDANRINPSATDFPFMWSVFSTTDNAVGGYQVPMADKSVDGVAGQEFIIEFNHPSYPNTISIYSHKLDSGVGTTLGNVAVRPDTGWIGIGVDNNDVNNPGYLWVNGTKQTLWSVGSNYWGQVGSGISLNAGNYGPSATLPYKGRLLEFGFGLEEINVESKADFTTYLNTRYGLSL